MPLATWPTTLPQQFLHRTFEETFADNRIRSETEMGPARVRRRTTAASGHLSGEMQMDYSQLAIFREFYQDTIHDGTFPFTMPYPPGSVAGGGITDIDVRFVEVPRWRRIAEMAFVSIDLEVLP